MSVILKLNSPLETCRLVSQFPDRVHRRDRRHREGTAIGSPEGGEPPPSAWSVECRSKLSSIQIIESQRHSRVMQRFQPLAEQAGHPPFRHSFAVDKIVKCDVSSVGRYAQCLHAAEYIIVRRGQLGCCQATIET